MALKKPKMGIASSINVTPMVDVMLVLLIIFMVITPMLQKGVSVDLAITQNPTLMPDADKEDSLVVAVTKDNKIYFGSELITDPSTLTEKVKDRFNNKNVQNQKVYIKADARTRYGNVVEVVDNVRAAGVDQLGLLTEQKKAPEKK